MCSEKGVEAHLEAHGLLGKAQSCTIQVQVGEMALKFWGTQRGHLSIVMLRLSQRRRNRRGDPLRLAKSMWRYIGLFNHDFYLYPPLPSGQL